MKNLIATISLTLLSTSFSSLCYAQYKYDIGLKFGTFDRNFLQLEQRFNINSNYSVFANISTGRRITAHSIYGETTGDTLINQYNQTSINRFYAFKLGATRKLSFPPNDFFYAGTAIGVGFEEFNTRDEHLVSVYDENGNTLLIPSGTPTTNTNHLIEAMNTGLFYQLYLTLGMNVPISQRLLINCEVDAIFIQSKNDGFNIAPALSIGLRYSFGKTPLAAVN